MKNNQDTIIGTMTQCVVCLGHIKKVTELWFGTKKIDQFEVVYDRNKNETSIKFIVPPTAGVLKAKADNL